MRAPFLVRTGSNLGISEEGVAKEVGTGKAAAGVGGEIFLRAGFRSPKFSELLFLASG